MVQQFPIEEADLGAVERWLDATLAHCRKLRDQQRHTLADNCAHGALKLVRVLHATQAEHGFFADLLTQRFEGAFQPFLRDAR